MTGVDETATEAFTHASRLTQQAEFRRVFARPRVSQDPYFRVLGRGNGLTRSRLGLAVSVKVSRRAVGRNRLKRLVRESFRRNQAILGQAPGIDIVVLPSRHAATMCNKTLFEALDGHWKQQQRLAGDPQEQQQGKN